VASHSTDIAVLLAVALAVYAAASLILYRQARRRFLDKETELEKKLLALTTSLRLLEPHLAKLRDADGSVSLPPEPCNGTANLPAGTQIEAEQEEIAPEILAAITAATAAFLGRHASIRSIRSAPARQVVSPWSQQGRVFVQASHNLRSRR
jgi:branched-subunit amino acid ABC-type transport system permease component